MRRNKLEMYIDVLKVLAHKGPQKITSLMFLANLNSSLLKDFLDFMTERNLVEKRKIGKKRVVYAITQEGRKVLLYFRELKVTLPSAIIRESQYVEIPRGRK